MSLVTRRGLIVGAASLLAAPAIVRASSIMKVRPLVDDNIWMSDLEWRAVVCEPIVTVQGCNGMAFTSRLGWVEHAIKIGRMKKEIIGGLPMYRELHKSQWGSEL